MAASAVVTADARGPSVTEELCWDGVAIEMVSLVLSVLMRCKDASVSALGWISFSC